MRRTLTGATTRLERSVQRECNRLGADYSNGVAGFLRDLAYGGCASGMVGSLIYYHDTISYFLRYRQDIANLLQDGLREYGCSCPSEMFGDEWDTEDVLAMESSNRNLLAWFAFEETARRLADRNGIEF